MVEPFWSRIRCGDAKKTCSATACLFELEVAPGLGLPEDQRRDALSVAGCRARRRSAGKLCYQASRTQNGIGIPQKMKRNGDLEIILTDKLRSYSAAMKGIVNGSRQKNGRWLNNRAENSHLPFRRRGGACTAGGRFEVCRSSL